MATAGTGSSYAEHRGFPVRETLAPSEAAGMLAHFPRRRLIQDIPPGQAPAKSRHRRDQGSSVGHP